MNHLPFAFCHLHFGLFLAFRFYLWMKRKVLEKIPATFFYSIFHHDHPILSLLMHHHPLHCHRLHKKEIKDITSSENTIFDLVSKNKCKKNCIYVIFFIMVRTRNESGIQIAVIIDAVVIIVRCTDTTPPRLLSASI